MVEGRIVRLFDATTVVINLGVEDGVERGMRFGIFTPLDDIVDPETGESLGSYRRRKGVVIASEVRERFTVCKTPMIKEDYTEEVGVLGFPKVRQRRTHQVPDQLDVAMGAEQPMPTGDEVGVGDVVALLNPS